MNPNKALDVKASDEHARLIELRKLISDSYEAANRIADYAKKKGSEAITEALLCGQYLNEAKKIIGHGKWLHWLSENMGGISQQTASNYMRLSNYQHVSNLNDCAGLRQAYIACGILPEPEAEQPKEVLPVWSNALGRVNKLKEQLTACPINQWPESEQNQIKTEVQELVALVS